MVVSLGSKGQADFTRPIELMMDCHRRIEHFLTVLGKVADRYGTHELDAEGRNALETALNYFRQAAPRHTADEEKSLFPRLRELDNALLQQVMSVLDHLENDHREVESAQARVDEIGRHWLAESRLNVAARTELSAILQTITRMYLQHIQLEEERVFALASQVLDADTLARVGREMKQRRLDNPKESGKPLRTR